MLPGVEESGDSSQRAFRLTSFHISVFPDSLTTLGLKQNNISGPGLCTACELVAQNLLTTLGLEFNDLTDQALPVFNGFTNPGKSLYLSYCPGINDKVERSGFSP